MKKLTLTEVLEENNITMEDYLKKVSDMAENEMCDFDEMREVNDNAKEGNGKVYSVRDWICEGIYGYNSGFLDHYLTANCKKFFTRTFEKYEDFDFDEFEDNIQDVNELMEDVLEEVRDDIWTEIEELLENDDRYSDIPLFNDEDENDNNEDEEN